MITTFEEAVKSIDNYMKMPKDKNKLPEEDILLKLYALYKQATIGDCNTSQPWFYNVKDRMKWDAWNSIKGTLKEKAKIAYIKLVNQILDKITLI